jgi:hypothetical protein
MTRKKARPKKPEAEYFDIAIRVERYEIRTEASINHHAFHPEYAYELDDNDSVYRFTADLTIFGTAFQPKDRAGHSYEVTVYGDDSPSSSIGIQLKHLHIRDKQGLAEYRTYRGKNVPVYLRPPDLGLLNKERGKSHWTAWVRVLPRLASDMLALLAGGQELYLALTETKDDRARWVRRLSLQTADPSKED